MAAGLPPRDLGDTAQGFLSLGTHDAFPATLRPRFDALAAHCKGLRPADRAGWRQAYHDLVDLARAVRDELGGATGPSPALAEARDFVRVEAARCVQELARELERRDQDAITYVRTQRLPKQRREQIGPAYLAPLAARVDVQVRESEGALVAVTAEGRAEVEAQARDTVFVGWQRELLDSLVAHVQTERAPLMERLGPALRTLSLPEPPLREPQPSALPAVALPDEQRQPLPSLPQAIWVFFRGGLSLIFLLVTLAASFGSQDRSHRGVVLVVALPLFAAIALVRGFQIRARARARAEAPLKAAMQAGVKSCLERAADHSQRAIEDAVSRFGSRHGSDMQAWRIQVLDGAKRASQPPGHARASSTAEVQVRALLVRQIERRLPPMEARLAELDGQA